MTSQNTQALVAPASVGQHTGRRKTLGSRLADLGPSPLVWILVVFNLAVVVWLLLSSVKTTREILTTPWTLPAVFQFDNYVRAWEAGNFGIATFNSIVLCVTTALGTVIFAAPAAYALTRLTSRTSPAVTVLFAVGMGIPSFAIFLPLFTVMNQLGLVNTMFGMWLLYTATSMPFAVFFLTGFFRSLPFEVEEAAALDGARPWRVFWEIVFPMARSGIITLIILNVIQHWGETFLALVFIQDSSLKTLPLALFDFLAAMQYSGADWAAMFAGLALVVTPMIIAYVFLARRIIEGMTLGSGK